MSVSIYYFFEFLISVEFFVEIGQNIEEADSNGYTALIIASAFGKANVVRFLLSKGACVWTNAYGLPALFFAAKQGHSEVCRELVAMGANINQESADSSPWLEACKKGHLHIVKFFVDNGGDIEFSYSDGATGLMYASRERKANVVRFLLSNGARTDRADAKGFTALDKAVENGHGEIILILSLHESARN